MTLVLHDPPFRTRTVNDYNPFVWNNKLSVKRVPTLIGKNGKQIDGSPRVIATGLPGNPITIALRSK